LGQGRQVHGINKMNRPKKTRGRVLIGVFFGLSCLARTSVADENDIQVRWKDSLRLETKDKKVQIRFGGRIQYDFANMSQDANIEQSLGSLQDGTEPRRARMYLSGILHKHVDFKAQYDFAGGLTKFKDVYIGLTGIPYLGKIKVGHMKEPFSLEDLTSSNNITFMERALHVGFAPSRNVGVLLSNHIEERITWAAGIFRNTDDLGIGQGDDDFNFTGRLTGTPWLSEESRQVIHLGFNFSHRSRSAASFRFRQRPEAHLTPRFVDTGTLLAQSANLVGPEFAWIQGPVSIQTEYVHASLDPVAGTAKSNFQGYYLLGSFFLTGEQRNYRASEGRFRGVKPKNNFNISEKSMGAWELAFRYSSLDLEDKSVAGGKLHDWTVGINWYLNAHARIMWNYIRADLDTVGAADILQMRLQLNF